MTDFDEFVGGYESIPEFRSKNPILRGFGNFCNVYPASFAMHRALYHEDKARYFDTKLSRRGHMWWKIYTILNAPYERWGTYYLLKWDSEKDKCGNMLCDDKVKGDNFFCDFCEG